MWHDYGMVALMIPIAGMIVPAIIIIFALERAYRIRKLDHEAKLAAIDKGYDVPMKRPSARYPFTWPLVLLGFGAALILLYMMNHSIDPEALGFGLVLFFIGAGLFASRFIGVKKQDDAPVPQGPAAWTAPAPASVPTSPGESSDMEHSAGA